MSLSRSLLSVRPASPAWCLLLLCLIILPVRQLKAEMVDRVVAVVNDDVITLSELDAEGQNVFRKIAATTPAENLAAELAAARADILETLIDKRLIAQKAAAKNITVSDAEVDAAFGNVLQRTRMTREQLLAKLQEAGLNETVYKTTLKSQILQNKLVGADVSSKIVVTEDMILDYYDTHYISRVDDGAFYLLQMGFSWQDPENGETSKAAQDAHKEDARKRAERVHNLARAGQDFGALARKFSDLPSRVDGGDIGTFQLNDMAAYMRDAVSELQPGEISEIIETPAGYQFFKLLSSGEDAIIKKASYEAVKDTIKQELYDEELQRAYAQWVRELKDQAYIQKL